MKKTGLALSLMLLVGLAWSQTAVPEAAGAMDAINAGRTRIADERTRLEAGFLAEDTACYKRFAVNKCLAEVNSRRREAMADLRRQEISLNDEERKMKGAEQLRKTEEKASLEKQQEAAERRAKAARDYQERVEKDRQKQEDRGTAKANEKSNADASADRLRASQQKAQGRTDKQSAAAEEARKYAEHQKEANERRAQHEADKLKRVKPPSKSLPVPE
jgi:colicin import membrane protein